MNDTELRDAALAELDQTTVGMVNTKWKTPPPGTHWAAARALLAQIGAGTSPPPPPGFTVKGMYDANSGRQAADWPTIAALGFNLLITAADDTAGLAAVKKTGGKAWVSCGSWTGSGFSTTDAQAVAMAKTAVATGIVAGFYVADEPLYSAQNVALIKARSNLLKQACPGIETLIAYFDAASLPDWKGAVDAFALDIYPSRFGWDYALITKLAAAAAAAGLKYYGVTGAFSAPPTYPLPTDVQLKAMLDTWAKTKQSGHVVYVWPVPSSLLAVLKAANG